MLSTLDPRTFHKLHHSEVYRGGREERSNFPSYHTLENQMLPQEVNQAKITLNLHFNGQTKGASDPSHRGWLSLYSLLLLSSYSQPIERIDLDQAGSESTRAWRYSNRTKLMYWCTCKQPFARMWASTQFFSVPRGALWEDYTAILSLDRAISKRKLQKARGSF